MRAIDEVEQRAINAPLTPQAAYDLTMKISGDKEAAMKIKVEMMLNQMPPLPQGNN